MLRTTPLELRAAIWSGRRSVRDAFAVAPGRQNGHAARVAAVWRVQDTDDSIDTASAVSLLRARLRTGPWETWFESDSGELLAVVTNGHRAMVMLLREPGDAGEHAIDPSAEGASTGYLLANGQIDTYADSDTIGFDEAMMRVACIIEERDRLVSEWKVDR